MATSILPDQARQYRTRIADRPEPPKCPYNNVFRDRKHPAGLNSRTCPTCHARRVWVASCRRARERAGEHTPVRRQGRTSIWYNPDLRKPVPKCRRYHPTADERRTCERCQARIRYTSALRHDAIREGTYLGLVDCREVVQHVTEVLEPSGLTRAQIAQHAGVTKGLINAAVCGRTKKMLEINASAVLSVKPAPYRERGRGGMANAAGVRRMMRGLYAQGWTASYMAELVGVSRSGIWRWISGSSPSRPYEFVQPEVEEAAKRLVDKLGPYDIAELGTPMDGMSRKVAARAAKRGWSVLADWDGLNVGDPRVVPHGADDRMDASNGLVLVDHSTVKAALRFQPTEDEKGVLTANRFTDPLTRMEFCEIVRAGSEPDHTGAPRVSANLLAQRLGVTERTVQRYRAEQASSSWVLDTAPPLSATAIAAGLILATAEWPAALRLRIVAALLAPYPIRWYGFYNHYVIVAATQPNPLGRGWSDDRLAAWLGCTEQDAADLRGRAVVAARKDVDRATGRAAKRRNRATKRRKSPS